MWFNVTKRWCLGVEVHYFDFLNNALERLYLKVSSRGLKNNQT